MKPLCQQIGKLLQYCTTAAPSRYYCQIVCLLNDIFFDNLLVISQISTSVQQTTEVVALMPTALTLLATSRATVYLDTTEMDSTVQVNQVTLVLMQI